MDYENIKYFVNLHGDMIFKDSQGLYHSDNGPAIIRSNGIKEYFCHGKRHNIAGPAIKDSSDDSCCLYYINDKEIPSALVENSANECDFTIQEVLEYYAEHNIFPKSKNTVKMQYNGKTKNPEKKELTMGNMFVSSMTEGAKRNSVRYLTEMFNSIFRNAIIEAFPEHEKHSIVEFMKTDYADMLVKALIGFTIPKMDLFEHSSIAQEIARECRVQSTEDIQKQFLSAFAQNVMPMIVSSFAKVENNINILDQNEQEVSEIEIQSAKINNFL